MTPTNTDLAPDLSDEHHLPARPTDILLELIVAFLTPMFMSASSGDLSFARLAAMETLGSYRARTQTELLHIAQIIGFGLAAMDNLWLSMADDASLSMKLRLRSGANALNRSAQQNIRMLEKGRCNNARPDPGIAAQLTMATARSQMIPDTDEDDITETDVQASIEQARAMIKKAHTRLQEAKQGAPHVASQAVPVRPAAAQPPVAQAAAPAVAAASAAARPVQAPSSRTGAEKTASIRQVPISQPSSAAPATASEQQNKLMWASAMTAVADDLSANLVNVSPAQRKSDRMWANALGASASSLAIAAASNPPPAKTVIHYDGKPPNPV